MKSKVSMVMPVYNKIDYIDMMLESVYKQVWNNIELIMVNDGATDGTREKLSEWEPKFTSRGFEVIIIDQENQGIPGAVKSGLMRISGDYVCVVDCDDMLDPEYVSVMAGWLDEHPEDMWAVCLWNGITIENGNISIEHTADVSTIPTPPNMMEKYLSAKYCPTIWIYMVRVEYLKKCKVVDGYVTDIKSTQEPGFVLPLINGAGKLKLINRPLYNYNLHDNRASLHKEALSAIIYHNTYRELTLKIINGLDADASTKKKWRILAEFAPKRFLIRSLMRFDDKSLYLQEAVSEVVSLVNKHFRPDPKITIESILINGFEFLSSAIADCILGTTVGKEPIIMELSFNRIIAWGAAGKRGRSILPGLRGTILEPTELWDIESNNSFIKKPDQSRLNSSDLVLVLPEYNISIISALKKCDCQYITYDKIIAYIARKKYPGFYDGTISFVVD